MTLKFAWPANPATASGREAIAWNKEVEAASDGELEIKMFPSGTLATFTNVLDRILNGVIDIGMGVFGEYTA